MQTDSNLAFTGGITGGSQSIAAAAVRSSGIFDLAQGLMITAGTYPASPVTGGNFLINNALLFSQDLEPGHHRLRFCAIIGAAFAGGTSLNIQIQGAADASAGVYPANLSGLTWTTYAETGPIPVADLGNAAAAGVSPGRSIIDLPDWPAALITTPMPRFISLNYVPVGSFSTGAISFAGVFTQVPDFNDLRYVGGFTVAP